MPTQEAENALTPMLAQAASTENAAVLGLLAHLPRPWSDAFGRSYLAVARKVLKERADNLAYQWAGTLFAAGRALVRESFAAALADWELAQTKEGQWHGQAVAREIEKFMEAVRTRRSFYDEVTCRANGLE